MILGKVYIDAFIRHHLRPARLRSLSVANEEFADYRFADFHRAISEFLKSRKLNGKIASLHHPPLSDLIAGTHKQHVVRRMNVAPSRLCAIGYEENEAFPDDCFWVFHETERNVRGVIRLKFEHSGPRLEVALTRSDLLANVAKEIVDLSVRHSVYRNHYLQIDLEPAINDAYGYAATHNGMRVTFRPPPKVDSSDIILDPTIDKLLERNVISFCKNRDRLAKLGLPLQRGVLLYGPPGTGKTFTCQYLYDRLQPITMLTVSGKGLSEVRSICTLARMLQPSVLVLEDVDLIFTSREVNLYSTALGEMMDELDAFKQNDSVLFLLTTNEIERLEKAIKDRPGRVSQCIYFGPPTRELRKRYLARYLQPFDHRDVSVDHVATISDGASQAFLEELVYRAVQIAAEGDEETTSLSDEAFEIALAEMTQHREKSVGAIVGFQSGRNE